MLHRVLLIARRDYVAVVMRKSFVIGLLALPLLFGSGLLGVAALKVKQRNGGNGVALVDRSGAGAAIVAEAAPHRLEVIVPDDRDAAGQRRKLAARIRQGDLTAFVETDGDSARYFSDSGGVATSEPWLANAVNGGMRRARLAKLGVDGSHFEEVFRTVPLQAMTPEGVVRNKSDLPVPLILMVLMTMVAMLGAATMLSAVAEDKLQRVFEMQLVSATPLELMAGKVVASVGCSLTMSVLYIAGALFALQAMAMTGLVSPVLVPWFLLYVVCEVTMLSALGAALGAACNAPCDAQQLMPLVIFPVMGPLMLIVPLIQQPNGTLATVLSLLPPFTPLVMIMRQAMPGGVPWWQPWAGLVGMLVWTVLTTWAAARVFRMALLMNGRSPNLRDFARWAVHG